MNLRIALRALVPAARRARAACPRGGAVAAPPPCILPDAALLVTPGEYEVAPGAVSTVQLLASTHPGAFAPLPGGCRPAWSLPDGGPASVDAASGVLRVAADAADGAAFPLLARVAGREVRTVVRVVDPARSPLVGTWAQVGRTPCGAGAAEAAPAEPIRELRFRRDGSFSVTWLPFESYTDYWGTYSHDAASGRLRLVVERGNYVPAELDLDGRAEVQGGVLRLREMSLGSRTPGAEPSCGLRFERGGP
ncbi:MAG TPA: hypothetical protein VFQ76_10535 [Longimicrobiaceae bacterium]|nr:hypothetical protein [Longimicrobiaceae bacterium]